MDQVLEASAPQFISIPKAKIHKTGLEIEAGTSIEEAKVIAIQLLRAEHSMKFLWGDLVIFVEASHGEMYAKAIEQSGICYGTLANAKYVCSRIPLLRRRPGLTFGHHYEAAAFEDEATQVYWLDRAEQAGWTVSEMRQAIRKAGASIAEQPHDPRPFQWLKGLYAARDHLAKVQAEDIPMEQAETLVEAIAPIAGLYHELAHRVAAHRAAQVPAA